MHEQTQFTARCFEHQGQLPYAHFWSHIRSHLTEYFSSPTLSIGMRFLRKVWY